MSSTGELIKQLLDDHGCVYEENVVHQLNEYAMKLMKNMLQGASDLAEMQKRNSITTDDIKIAYEYLQNPSTTQQDIAQVAMEKNNQQLNDAFKDVNYGIKLPASESNKLVKPNFQVIVKTQPDQVTIQQMDVEKQNKQLPKLGRKKINIEMDEEW